MRIGIVGSLVTLLASAGLTFAQPASSSRSGGLAPPGAAAPADPPPTPGAPAAARPAPGGNAPVQKVSAQQAPATTVSATSTSAPIMDVPPPNGTPLWSDGSPPHYPDDNSILKQTYPCGYAWISFESLLWFVRDQHTPPLVTTGPTNVPPAEFGVIGSPGTTVLLGGSLNYDLVPGLRLSGGIQGPDHAVGLEGNFFVLDRRSTGVNLASDATGDQIIARPFTDVGTGTNSRLLTSGPGAFAGGLDVTTSSRFFGGEVNVTHAAVGMLGVDSSFELDLLAGFKYLDLTERLSFGQNSVVLPGGTSNFDGVIVLAGTGIQVTDAFDTHNQFYGPQLGTSFEYQYCHLFFYGDAKVGLGVVHEMINNQGSTTMIPAGGGAVSVPGGLLALPTNIGRLTHNEFSATPQIDLNCGYQICKNVRLSVGYSFLYWGTVARPGDQLNGNNITIQQLPTSPSFGPFIPPGSPALTIHKSDFWAQGIDLQLAFHF